MRSNCGRPTWCSIRPNARRSSRTARARLARSRGAGAGRGCGAGRRECGADRMAGTAARAVRSGVPRGAARGDPADDAGEPEIFRVRGCGWRSGARVRVRGQYRGGGRGRGDRRGQPARARGAAQRCAVFLGAGPGEAAGDYLPGLERVVFHEKLGTMRTRPSGWRSWRGGWWRAGRSAFARAPQPSHKGEGLERDLRTPSPLWGGRVGVTRRAREGWPTWPTAPGCSPRPIW